MDKVLKEEIVQLMRQELRRIIVQENIFPDVIKQRHIGEGVRFVRAGLIANRPTIPEKNGAVYYATDENKFYIGDTGAWLEETFT